MKDINEGRTMIKLAYCDVSELDLSKGYKLVSEDRKSKISRFMFDKDKKLSCGAYLLLMKMLNEENIIKPTFKTEKYGKTYISNYNNIHFNISHSGKYVACGISDNKIGVDIEYNDSTIDLDIAKHYFYNEEYKNIMKSDNPSNEFFKYWVLKESYMKYTGLGFNLALNSFEITITDEIRVKPNDTSLRFSLFDVNEYKVAVANKYKVKECEEYLITELY